jgi:hypothetical protein
VAAPKAQTGWWLKIRTELFSQSLKNSKLYGLIHHPGPPFLGGPPLQARRGNRFEDFRPAIWYNARQVIPRIVCFIMIVLIAVPVIGVSATGISSPGLGVDVDFYTGPIAQSVWLKMKQSGIQFVIAQAWGGRSRNEFAVSQLEAARSAAGMKSAAYVLLNYDDKVCPTFDKPQRDANGSCQGNLIPQAQPGGRWQVRQALAALGSEVKHIAFVAIDVEWFTRGGLPSGSLAESHRRQRILDAIDEVQRASKRPVIYTRNVRGHWADITGCDASDQGPDCRQLFQIINNPQKPIPLWDVQTGEAILDNFQPYGAWTSRFGRQYQLDGNLFGLPASRTVDLNVFDASLFSVQ